MSVELREMNQRLDSVEQRITRLEVRAGLLQLPVAGRVTPGSSVARNGAVTVDLIKARLSGCEQRVARLEAERHG